MQLREYDRIVFSPKTFGCEQDSPLAPQIPSASRLEGVRHEAAMLWFLDIMTRSTL